VNGAALWRGEVAGRRLSLLYAATFFEMGVQIPFLPVWLGERGLSDDRIAIILAAPLAIRVVATPFIAALADRRGDVAGALTASAIVLASCCALIGFVSGFAPLLIAVSVLACAQGLIIPLSDALTASVFRAHEDGGGRLDYGRIRKWGSASYIAGNLFGGLYVAFFSIDKLTILLTVAALMGVAACLSAAPLGADASNVKTATVEPAQTRGFALLPLVIAAAALINASHGLLATFGSLHWAREGHSGAFVGAAWAIGVICETLVFAVAGRWFSGPRSAFAMLAMGGGTAMLRWLVMASDPASAPLLFVQSAHGLTFGLTHLGSMQFIFANAPARMRARAQGWLSASIGGCSALVVMLGGPLYAHLGEIAYLPMAGLAAAGLAIILFAAARQIR
jgi:MFS transporter, PPP family, 3-phenylpropionic acid transporter